MEIKHIKIPAIPKNIRKTIVEQSTQRLLNKQPNTTRFFYYMDFRTREPKKIICATKWIKNRIHIQIATVKTFDKTFINANMKFTYIGGYGFDWREIEDQNLYENNWLNWNPAAYYIGSIGYEKSKYKYSGLEFAVYDGVCGLLYLAMWEQHNCIEYFAKAGFAYLSSSIRIVKKVEKDKGFVKYLLNNKKEISTKRPGTHEIIYGYTNKLPVGLAIELKKIDYDSELIKVIGANGVKKFFEYLNSAKKSFQYYKDYFDACIKLGIDMGYSKNLYPKDLTYWHDMRTDQIYQIENEQVANAMIETYEKYKKCEFADKDYVVLLAKSHSELVKEGTELNHCVGKMNYDKKIAEQKSLIAFIRHSDNQSVPFVTLELDIATATIRQCYALNNSRPDAETERFVYQKWKQYATRQIKKIAG